MENCSQLAKAAVVLKNLPSVQSGKVLARLESSDLRTVFKAINELDLDTTRKFFDALDDLAREAQKHIDNSTSEQVSDKPVAGNPQQLADAASNPFGFLFSRSFRVVADLLADEHPREIAVVLTHLPKQIAASLLLQLEPVHRVAVVRRMCDQSMDNERETTSLAIALRQRLGKMDRAARTNPFYRQKIGEILKQLGSAETQQLADQAGGDAPLLDQFAFQNSRCFNAFKNCSAETVRKVFRQTDPAIWASALRECDPPVRRHIMKSLSPSDSRLVGRQMIDLTCQVAPPCNIAQQQLADALAGLQ